MTSPFYSYTLITFTRGLNELIYLLKKGENHAKENNIPLDELLNARLAEDMQPLSFQIVTATNTVGKALARAAFTTEIPPQHPPDASYRELYIRLEKYLSDLQKVDPALISEKEGQVFIAPIGPHNFEYTLTDYSVRFSLPNFYFHAVTAYAILRSKGVQIGKLDWLNEFTA